MALMISRLSYPLSDSFGLSCSPSAGRGAGSKSSPPSGISALEFSEEIVRKYKRAPSAELAETVVSSFSWIAEKYARRLRGLEAFDELVQVGRIGLFRALGRFDPDAGILFKTFANTAVHGELLHHLRDRRRLIRVPAWLLEKYPSYEIPLVWMDHTEGEGLDRSLFVEDELVDRVNLDLALDSLAPRDKEVITRFYLAGESQTEIAQALGYSCNYVSHLLRGALRRLDKVLCGGPTEVGDPS